MVYDSTRFVGAASSLLPGIGQGIRPSKISDFTSIQFIANSSPLVSNNKTILHSIRGEYGLLGLAIIFVSRPLQHVF